MKNVCLKTTIIILIATLSISSAGADKKIAVVGDHNDNIADIIDGTVNNENINGVGISESGLDSTYDAVVCVRCGPGSDLKNYIENGYGGYVGEWEGNDYPYTEGWISGTSSQGTSGAQSLDRLKCSNHYLREAIDYENLPWGEQPLDYVRDISDNDPSTCEIALMNHNSYGVIPFTSSAPNPYGDGHLVIANSDWSDAPKYNKALENAIRQWAYWAAKKNPVENFCDYRGSSEECIMNETRKLDNQRYNVSSVFEVREKAFFESFASLATLNISNNSYISGSWFGSFRIISQRTRLKSGASFKPQNGRIVIGR